MRGRTAVAAFVVLILACALAAPAALAHDGGPAKGCGLANGIKHVIYVQFDNTHLFRDRPQFASDLEQMPHLLGFMRRQGTLNDNDHTILIAHTAGGMLSAFTGLYPDRNGQTVTNSYGYFKDDGTPAFASSFTYWTDLVESEGTPPADGLPNMVNADSGEPRTTPAPWVPYTRAGCDFGAVASANVVLENTSTGPNGDITKVFGQGSPEWNEALASNAAPAGTAARALAQTDFVGFAVHCGRGGGLCRDNADAKPDVLPDEPGGYAGFRGLFGAKAVNPAITGGRPVVKDTEGQPITDPFGQPGFPGFDGMLAKVSLGCVAQMQEAGVPVTYAYISDAHDNHAMGRASGPGEADYRAQPFALHFDSAPTAYVTGRPERTDPAVRQLERDVAAAQAVDPYVSPAKAPITKFLVDPVAEHTLHMVNADPRRTPTFTLFANPDYFVRTGDAFCPDAAHPSPVCIDYHFAWSHGDATEDIGRIWLGLVGPGVRNLGQTSSIWADHTDVRPTMLALLGLNDSYQQDGRVMSQALRGDAVPPGLRRHRRSLALLGGVYKQITAPFGAFAHDVLVASTRALAGGSEADDSSYTATEDRIAALTERRDALVAQIRTVLNDAAFGDPRRDRIDERRLRRLTVRAAVLLIEGRRLAAGR
jgi:hypothetical protein